MGPGPVGSGRTFGRLEASGDRPKGTNMRRLNVSVFTATLLIVGVAPIQTPAGAQERAQSAEAKEAAARYASADIRVMAPGVIYNAGLLDLAAAYTKETGKKVAVTSVGMGTIVKAVKTANPPADVIMLPLELMSTLTLDGGVVPGSFVPLGRSEMGLAVPAGVPHPDISSVEKLAAVLHSAKAVMRSNPAGGSMVASVIEDKVIKRPEFAGVNSPVSTRGEGGQALIRGEGDMALQAICEILPYKQIELVAPLPRELGAWIDMSTAVSARAQHRDDASAFLKYLLRPESNTVWKAKGLERFN
jgi:molybdate transport system substrate-binding protein